MKRIMLSIILVFPVLFGGMVPIASAAVTLDQCLSNDAGFFDQGDCRKLAAESPITEADCLHATERLPITASCGGIVTPCPLNAAVVATYAGRCAKEVGNTVKLALCIGGIGDPTNPDCCIYQQKEADADGKGELKRVECKNGTKSYLGDCYCRVGETIAGPKIGQSYQSCTDFCKEKGGEVDNTQGIGLFKPKPGQTAGATGQEQTFVNALCFTTEECASSDYGGSADAWFKDPVCPGGKGKCRAQEPVLTLSSPILGVTSVQGMRSYVDLMFRYLLSIVVLAAAVAFMWGGFKYIVGSSLGDITSAKNTMVNAVVGLLLCFGAVTILNTLNPATTRYDKLDVWLINKQEFAQFQWCKDYKPAKKGKPVMYADAGDPPGSASYDAGTFDKIIDTTYCGKQYYPQGFSGATCKGQSCLPDKTKVCLPCAAGIKECLGNTVGSACVTAAIAGNLTFQDEAQPLKVYLLAVCNYAQTTDHTVFSNNVPANIEIPLTPSGGSVSMMLPADNSIYSTFTDKCSNGGGLRGVLFGVLYNDPEAGSAKSGAKAGCAAGMVLGPAGCVAGTVVGGVLNAVNLGPSLDDLLIMSKQNCSGSVTSFAGYADGTKTSFDSTDMKTALWCGWHMKPGQTTPADNPSLFEGGAGFWTPAELQEAMNGTKPITCDSFFNKNNAPPDPGKNLMNGCNVDTTF